VLVCHFLTSNNEPLCPECRRIGYGKLQVEDAKVEEKCPYCDYVMVKKVAFPTGCGHFFCPGCVNSQFFPNVGISECMNGCPPCPNDHCPNPLVGTQCDCKEYIPIKQAWRAQFPQEALECDFFQRGIYRIMPTSKRCHTCQLKFVAAKPIRKESEDLCWKCGPKCEQLPKCRKLKFRNQSTPCAKCHESKPRQCRLGSKLYCVPCVKRLLNIDLFDYEDPLYESM
jgi:hypothetical protein